MRVPWRTTLENAAIFRHLMPLPIMRHSDPTTELQERTSTGDTGHTIEQVEEREMIQRIGTDLLREADNGARSETLFDYLKGRWKWVLGSVSLTILITSFYLLTHSVQYASTVMVMVSGQQLTGGGEAKDLPQLSPEITQLLHAVTSTEMTDHLIERFQLGSHYKVASVNPFHLELTTKRLLNNMDVRVIDKFTITITIKDRDRELAATMANACFDKLQAIEQAQRMEHLENNMAIYERIITSTKQSASDQADRLIELIREMRTLMPLSSRPDKGSVVAETEQQFSQQAAILMLSQEDLVRTRRNYEVSAAVSEAKGGPHVILVRKAMQDISTSQLKVALAMIVPLALVTFFAVVLGFTIWYKHAGDLKEYWLSFNAP